MSKQPRVRVVVADDAEHLRSLLCQALETNYDISVVGQAADGAHALEMVGVHRPDVLLLDLSMPVLDGLEVLRRVSEQHPGVSVVVFSGYGSAALEGTCRDLGAVGYIEKGAPLDQVASSIAQAKDSHNAR